MQKIKFPIIILNFKNYEQTIGKKGLKLSKIAESVAKEAGVEIAICAQTADIRMIAENVEIPIFAQHVDFNSAGSYTGNNMIETIIEAGARGSLINHSEKRLKLAEIEDIISKANEKDFFSCVCANNIQTSKAVTAMSPSACAMEPPELIGSGISVTTKPELVKNTIDEIKNIDNEVFALVGAGVSTAQDVKEALQLGAKGVLLASGYVKAKNPKKVLTEMANATIE